MEEEKQEEEEEEGLRWDPSCSHDKTSMLFGSPSSSEPRVWKKKNRFPTCCKLGLSRYPLACMHIAHM